METSGRALCRRCPVPHTRPLSCEQGHLPSAADRPGRPLQRGSEGRAWRVSPASRGDRLADHGQRGSHRGRVVPSAREGCSVSAGGTSGLPVGTACRRPPQLYLEPFELAFDVHLQSGKHGLVLTGQALEPAEVTVTGTPRPSRVPKPLLPAGPTPQGCGRRSGTWRRSRRSPPAGRRCAGRCGRLWTSRSVQCPSWWCRCYETGGLWARGRCLESGVPATRPTSVPTPGDTESSFPAAAPGSPGGCEGCPDAPHGRPSGTRRRGGGRWL